MFVASNRFVRFVSTPEILERVSTLESEILQIEEAISIQGNNDTGQSNVNCLIYRYFILILIWNQVLINVAHVLID